LPCKAERNAKTREKMGFCPPFEPKSSLIATMAKIPAIKHSKTSTFVRITVKRTVTQDFRPVISRDFSHKIRLDTQKLNLDSKLWLQTSTICSGKYKYLRLLVVVIYLSFFPHTHHPTHHPPDRSNFFYPKIGLFMAF